MSVTPLSAEPTDMVVQPASSYALLQAARVRNRIVLLAADEKAPGRVVITMQNTIEIEGETKPALIAESLSMLMTAPPATPGARP